MDSIEFGTIICNEMHPLKTSVYIDVGICISFNATKPKKNCFLISVILS